MAEKGQHECHAALRYRKRRLDRDSDPPGRRSICCAPSLPARWSLRSLQRRGNVKNNSHRGEQRPAHRLLPATLIGIDQQRRLCHRRR